MVGVLLSNLWSLSFYDVSELRDFRKITKYVTVVVNFLNVFLILVALGSRLHGMFLIISVFFAVFSGFFTRLLIGLGVINNEVEHRIFITSDLLTTYGVLFGCIMTTLYVLERIDNKN